MQRYNFIVVGGGAAGPKAAAVLRRRLPQASIVLFQKEELLSYARCGLPYYASGDIESLSKLTQTAYGVERNQQFFENSRGFEVRTGCVVESIDRQGKTIQVRDIENNQVFECSYNKLILATGASATLPPLELPESERIRTFHSPSDAEAFRKLAERGQVGNCIVMGGGLVGCEVAEAAGGLWGIDVTLIELQGHLLGWQLDREMSELAHIELKRQGVKVLTSTKVTRVLLSEKETPIVETDSGESLATDYLVIAAGVKPNVDLPKTCGLELGESGGIKVNARMQTSDQDIYAGGDCVESINRLTGKPCYLPMGSIANRQGRVIAENMAGNDTTFNGVIGSFMLKLFDRNIGAVGLTQRAASELGLQSSAVWGSFSDRPDYYPEHNSYTLKMVYQTNTGRLLGLQSVGAGNVARLIDVFAVYLQKEGTVEDLLDFEHGYAPAYSEALDPLYHLACMVQANEKGQSFVCPGCVGGDDSTLLLDIRENEEVEESPLTGVLALNGRDVKQIPLGEIVNKSEGISKDSRILLVCKRGARSYQAAKILEAKGYERVDILAGGLQSLGG